MARFSKAVRPSDGEMEILQILWARGPSTVRDVHEELANDKPVVYTTTLKVMQIMAEKGLLSRQQQGKAHLYSPAQETGEAKRAILTDFIDRVFGGSSSDLVLHALSDKVSSAEELEAIKNLIADKEVGR